MHVDMVHSAEACVLRLKGSLTIERAHELKQTLLEALRSNERIVLELEGVTEIDLSCLQLLCSAHRTSLRLDRQLTLHGERSEALRMAVRDAGFPRILGCHENPDRGCLWTGGWES